MKFPPRPKRRDDHQLQQYYYAGLQIWVLDYGRTIKRGADGRPTHVPAALFDISERKALEQEPLHIAERMAARRPWPVDHGQANPQPR
jgi:PAS domain-containing protein